MKNSQKIMQRFMCWLVILGYNICVSSIVQAMEPERDSFDVEVKETRVALRSTFIKVKEEYIRFLKNMKANKAFFNCLEQSAQKEFISMLSQIAYEPFAWTPEIVLLNYPNLNMNMSALVNECCQRRAKPRLLENYPDYETSFKWLLWLNSGNTMAILLNKPPLSDDDSALLKSIYEMSIWSVGTALVFCLERERYTNLSVALHGLLSTLSIMDKEKIFQHIEASLQLDCESIHWTQVILKTLKKIREEEERIELWDSLEQDLKSSLQAEGKLPPDEEV